MTVRTDRLWRNTMQEAGYKRFRIEPKPAPHVYQIPNKFDVSARKLRLAAMLVHEAFEYKLRRIQTAEAQMRRMHEMRPGISAHHDGQTI